MAHGETPSDSRRRAVVPLRFVILVLAVLAGLALVSLWAPLVFSIWTAALLGPFGARLAKRLGGRERAAAFVLSCLVVLVLLLPLALISASLALSAGEFAKKLHGSAGASALRALVPGDIAPSLEHLDPRRMVDFVQSHGAAAVSAAGATLGTLTAFAIGVVVYVLGFYESLVNGRRAYAWLEDRRLISRTALRRLSDAFLETGRGLIVGIGGTALLQGAVATVGYLVVGVPQPFLLGFITILAALIPSVGTVLVWAPVTVALFVTGRTTAGVVLLGIGSFAAVVDNLVRPWLSRYGALRLPAFVSFVAMLGGAVVFGGWGLVLGPLFVRLGVEGLDIWREARRV